METTHYHLAIDDPHAHFYAVAATFAGPFEGGTFDVRVPTWTPGSYLQREYARHFQNVGAEDESGKPLPLEKVEKAVWRIKAGAASRVTVRARVYANDLTVRTSHVDATHAYFNGANVFFYRKETMNQPATLSLDVPEGWSVATGLPPGTEPGTWSAEDYDHLVDCPVEMGTHARFSFEVGKIPHEVVVWGEGNYETETLRADLKKICEAQSRMMGGLPFTSYLFIVHLTDKGRGGLEHRNSSSLLAGRFGFKPRKEYEEFLRLASHEYFHSWNVKRLKPKAFDPYDYSAENYTRLLWAMEGFTVYYELMAMARAGVLSRKRLLELWGEEITMMLRRPGHKAQSLSESSFDAWIKLYRPDENSVNSGISYYLKGAVVALVLDLEIRGRTGGGKSLDDVVRTLYERHGAKGKGAPEDAYVRALAEAGGASMEALVARYVDGTDEIDFAAHLAHAGLTYHTRPSEGTEDTGGTSGKKAKKTHEALAGTREDEPAENPVWLGFATRRERGGRAVVAHVLTGSPAQRGGLYAGDELVALAGWRADDKSWRARLADHAPGDRIPLTVLRRDRLTEVTLTAEAPPHDTAWIEEDSKAPEAAKEILASWLSGTRQGGVGG